MPPFFTIITVNLNAGSSLKATAESVANQSFPDYEHIIKDGGSTDGCLDFIPIIQNKSKIKIVINKDKGIYDAMNQALTICSGKYVLFLNAGDTLASDNILDNVASYLKDNSTIELLYCDYINQECNSRIMNPARLTEFYLFRTMLCHQVCFIGSDCFSKYGNFNLLFTIVADYELLCRVVLKGKISCKYLPLLSTNYLGEGFSTIPSLRQKKALEINMVRAMYYPLWKRYLYGLIIAASFPLLRNAINIYPIFRWIRPFYIASVNNANRIIYGHPQKFKVKR